MQTFEEMAGREAVARLRVLDAQYDGYEEMQHAAHLAGDTTVADFWAGKTLWAHSQREVIGRQFEGKGVERCLSCGAWRYREPYLLGTFPGADLCDLCLDVQIRRPRTTK